MAQVTDSDLAKDCLLKWWEVALMLERWSAMQVDEGMAGKQNPRTLSGGDLGQLDRDVDETAAGWARRIVRGLIILSREDD